MMALALCDLRCSQPVRSDVFGHAMGRDAPAADNSVREGTVDVRRSSRLCNHNSSVERHAQDKDGPDHGWKVFLDEAAASQLWKVGG